MPHSVAYGMVGKLTVKDPVQRKVNSNYANDTDITDERYTDETNFPD